MKASDLFLRCLEAEGVEYIFGVPGEENADVMMSLLDSPIRFIICRHEQGAAFMADLYGRLTGKPGVCLGTLGPGATNLTTGVANADMDRSPLVVITGQGATTRLHKESHQIMDAVAMFEPMTKWAHSILDPANIPEVVRKAFKCAVAEKPGAAHIELPEDIAKEEVDERPIVPGLPPRRPVADERTLHGALRMIAEAERPIILAGNGCVRKRVSDELLRFVDATGIYAAMTFMGKGALSDRHERSLYAAGLGSRDHVAVAFERADVVIAIGYDLVEWHPSRWNAGGDKRVLHLDFEPAEVDTAYRPEIEVVGDLAGAMAEINERLGPEHKKNAGELEELRRRLYRELEQEHADDGAFPIKPQRILADLRRELRDDDILISDVGAHKMWVARHYPTFTPGSCIISNGFCSMGIAVPGAISAKMVHPEREIVGLCGDGGFLMNVQEIATAVQYRVAPTFLVWEDGEYGLIKWKQEATYGKHSHVHFQNPDLVELSRAFGCHALRVEKTDDLRAALREARDIEERPSVVIVPVDYDENLKLTRELGDLVCPS